MVRSWVVACLLSLSLPWPAAADSHVVLQLSGEPSYRFAGYYAALDQGYYAAAGLEVELRVLQPGMNVVTEVTSGQAQFGVGSSSLLVDRYAGQPVVVLAAIFQHSPLAIASWLNPDQPIETIHDLASERIALDPGTQELQVFLRRAGISANAVETLATSASWSRLLEGSSEAASVYLPQALFDLRQLGQPYWLHTPRMLGLDFYGDVLFTSEAVLPDRGRLEAFVAASLQGWQYAMANPEVMVESLRARTDLEADALRYEYDQLVTLIHPELMSQMYPERWQSIADAYIQAELLPPSFSLQGFLYSPPDGGLIPVWFLAYGIGASVGLLAVGWTALWVCRINRRLSHNLVALQQAQASLAMSEARFRTLIEATAAGILVRDGLQPANGGQIVLANPWLRRTCGLQTESLPLWAELILEHNGEQLRLRTPDDSLCWVRCLEQPIRYDDRDCTLVTLLDITPEKQAKAELRSLNQALEERVHERTRELEQKEQFITNLVTTSPAILYVLDIEAERNIFVSPNIESIMGYTPAEAMMAGFHRRVLKPEVWQQSIELLQTYDFEGNFLSVEEIPMYCANGEERWFLVLETVYKRDINGRVTHTIGNCLDITERWQAELERQASEQRYRELVESVGCVIGRWKPDGTIIYINPFGLKLFGYREDELIGQPIVDSILPRHDLDGEDLAILIEDIVSEPEKFRFNENINCCKDGSLVWIAWGNTVVKDATGTAIEVLATGIDITARKQAEAAKRQSEAQFHYLANHVPALVWMTDTTGKCVYFNEPWLQFTGRTFEQEYGDGWLEGVHPDDRDRCFGTFLTAFQAQQPFTMDYRLRHADDTYRWVLDVGAPQFNLEGELSSYIGSVIDITERRAIEDERERIREQLRLANAEMSRALELKNDFLANMSHELRTPLNAILGMAEVLQAQYYGTLNEKQLKSASTIERSANHLLSLINDILDLMRMEANQEVLQLAPVAVNTISQEALDFFAHKAQQKQITLSFVCCHSDLLVLADGRRLLQILLNLLSNAVKFTPEGGQVSLEVDLDAPQHQVVFRVRDTGIGIERQDLAKLFQKFSQLDAARNRKYEGTGLGLALVKSLTELHQGTISVSSELGQGSCFEVRLPYTAPTLLSSGVQLCEGKPLVYLASDRCDESWLDYLTARGLQAVTQVPPDCQPNVVVLDVTQVAQVAFWQQHHVPVIGLLAADETLPEAAPCLHQPVPLRQVLEAIRSLLVASLPTETR